MKLSRQPDIKVLPRVLQKTDEDRSPSTALISFVKIISEAYSRSRMINRSNGYKMKSGLFEAFCWKSQPRISELYCNLHVYTGILEKLYSYNLKLTNSILHELSIMSTSYRLTGKMVRN